MTPLPRSFDISVVDDFTKRHLGNLKNHVKAKRSLDTTFQEVVPDILRPSFDIVPLPRKSFLHGHRLSMGDDVPDFPILGLVQCSTSVAAGSPVGPGFHKFV